MVILQRNVKVIVLFELIVLLFYFKQKSTYSKHEEIYYNFMIYNN